MSENEFMNIYVHPILKKALWRFSGISYEPRPIQASAYCGNASYSDGIAYTTGEKSYEISVTEGSRPYVIDYAKETSNYIQNARAVKDMINFTVISEVKLKRAPPLQIRVFMVQCIGLSLRFYFMDYLGAYRLFEIEKCEIPTDFTEVNSFPSFFKAIITWALMVGEADKRFQMVDNRSTRYSYAHNLRLLSNLNTNKPRPVNSKIIKEEPSE
ncbi:2172_t:CDS:2 [Acaulospora morrowiae]|uniref:2172_t:CDS:1 n=1 Tax=Acaulospora morrowiae TaxID=94023 RepID=A0A9N9GXL0_9GLOM|nr:2172_t:CDS:2 [Acaulospora morrowiae]